MLKYVYNGRFLTRRITGVERYAFEILCELDKIVGPGLIVVAVPRDSCIDLKLTNIQIRKVGHFQGVLWEQLELPCYIRKLHAIGIHLCNAAPLIKPDIVCIHDVNIRVNPQFFRKLFVLWYRIQFGITTRCAKRIVTVSRFSKSEIEKYYPVSKNKIVVMYNGWQHMLRVQPDYQIFEKYECLNDSPYYFSLSSKAPNKNLKWIVQTAKKNPDTLFVMAGKKDNKVFGNLDMPVLDNILHLGYISDGEVKALMERCQGFLFPSFYEGFGIPPLEALSVGANVICSDITVHHEIYENSAIYIDPYKTGTLRIINIADSEKEKILKKYSYAESAKKLLMIMKEQEKKDVL